jgi:hypothetical protein
MEIKLYLVMSKSMFKARVKNNQLTIDYTVNSSDLFCSPETSKISSWIASSIYASFPEELIIAEVCPLEKEIGDILAAFCSKGALSIDRVSEVKKILDTNQFLLLG